MVAELRDDRRPTVFIHDFSPVDATFDAAVAALQQNVSTVRVANLVADAYQWETNPSPAMQLSDVVVNLGPSRLRPDAVVVPMSWQFPTGRGLPVEADLELASYQPGRCHLHLLGRATLFPDVELGTQEASLCGRLAVAVVRHVLNDLAVLCTGTR